MTIGEKIKQARIDKGLTQEELASKLGYKSRSSVNKIETGGRDIPRSQIKKIAEILQVSPISLLGFEDERPARDDLSALAERYDNILPVKLKRFPLLGEIACGEPIFANEDKESYVMADMDIHADFCLRAKGDSMINARIFDGDLVFVRKMPIVDNGDIAAVIIEDEATLKRVYYDRENNLLQLVAENPRYKPLVYSGEELDHIHILGKAVYFMSAL